MIKIIVTIAYNDDTEKKFECCDVPNVGGDFVVLYLYKEPLSRNLIKTERISEISWTFK